MVIMLLRTLWTSSVKNWGFETVLERGADPMREERLAVLQRAGLSDHYAAEKILDYLNHALGLVQG